MNKTTEIRFFKGIDIIILRTEMSLLRKEINKYAKEENAVTTIECECGCKYTFTHKSIHVKVVQTNVMFYRSRYWKI